MKDSSKPEDTLRYLVADKLKMLINRKWDENIGDAPMGSDAVLGGLNVSEIAKVYPNIFHRVLSKIDYWHHNTQ